MSEYFTELAASIVLLLFAVFSPVLCLLVVAFSILMCVLFVIVFWLFKCGQALWNVLGALFGRPYL